MKGKNSFRCVCVCVCARARVLAGCETSIDSEANNKDDDKRKDEPTLASLVVEVDTSNSNYNRTALLSRQTAKRCLLT